MNTSLTIWPEAVIVADLDCRFKALRSLADLFHSVYGFDREAVLEGLEQREALGSTAFGRGVAIPHCRLPGLQRPTAVLIKLETACDFGAADAVSVGLVFGLVSPENAGSAHLHALAAISRLSRDDDRLQALSDAEDPDALFALLTNQFLRDAA